MSDDIVVVTEETIQLGALSVRPADVVARASVIATTLASVIEDRKLYATIKGKRHVVVEGWTTLGALLGVTPRAADVREISEGVFEARVELVRASDGVVIGGGIAECGSSDELDSKGQPMWANRPRYARKSMAITRATGKAFRLAFSWIVTLAGYEPTPAEEMGYESGQRARSQPAQRQPRGVWEILQTSWPKKLAEFSGSWADTVRANQIKNLCILVEGLIERDIWPWIAGDALYGRLGIARDSLVKETRLAFGGRLVGRDLASFNELENSEVFAMIAATSWLDDEGRFYEAMHEWREGYLGNHDVREDELPGWAIRRGGGGSSTPPPNFEELSNVV